MGKAISSVSAEGAIYRIQPLNAGFNESVIQPIGDTAYSYLKQYCPSAGEILREKQRGLRS